MDKMDLFTYRHTAGRDQSHKSYSGFVQPESFKQKMDFIVLINGAYRLLSSVITMLKV